MSYNKYSILLRNINLQVFQEVEESYLKQMKDFLNMYTEVIEANHEEIGKVSLKLKCINRKYYNLWVCVKKMSN